MAGKGTLVAELYTARRAIPIMGASVTVSRVNGEDTELIAYRRSDQNGMTTPIEIETPDVEASLRPSMPIPEDGNSFDLRSGMRNNLNDDLQGQENGAEQPFTTVNIQIDHPLYYSILIENAQIFPGQESRQRIEMVPLPEFTNGSKNTTFYVRPQNL